MYISGCPSPYVWTLHLHKVLYYMYISGCPSPSVWTLHFHKLVYYMYISVCPSPYVWTLHLHEVVYYMYISGCPSPYVWTLHLHKVLYYMSIYMGRWSQGVPPLYEPFISTKLLLHVDGEVISGCLSPSSHIYYISNVNMRHKAAWWLAILPEIYL